ncbi:hypothetical protein SASPL_101668 [Salvia splendens]|uniref:ALOG domain-containing protein n=1 Tax=Salvia splendens TaxID=180675 RepID=A0A8X9ADI2_SALSN|nr:hypothetical protein SASPL_101668 [Salvia splendens]
MDSASAPDPGDAGPSSKESTAPPSRYESQKRRDWNTFLQYLKNHKPPLTLARCSGAHVIEFLKYLDQFGKTKAVRIYLREVRESQAKARGIPYEKKKRKRPDRGARGDDGDGDGGGGGGGELTVGV